jgi:hypothetical protein
MGWAILQALYEGQKTTKHDRKAYSLLLPLEPPTRHPRVAGANLPLLSKTPKNAILRNPTQPQIPLTPALSFAEHFIS